MLDNYIMYLSYMQNKISKFFNEQKDYIFCKKGCTKCCKNAQFPYTEMEFRLLYQGLMRLNPVIQRQVLDKVDLIIIDKHRHNIAHPDEKFRYDCPFLINEECSVYNYRGLVCRAFGLMSFIPNSDNIPKIPFCAFQGLNYSNVVDEANSNISEEKFNSLDIKQEPKAYNVDYSRLISKEYAEKFGFEFGEAKPLIEWFIQWKDEIIKLFED